MNYMNDDLVQLHATFCHMDGQEEHHLGSVRSVLGILEVVLS